MSSFSGIVRFAGTVGMTSLMAVIMAQPVSAADAIEDGQWYHAMMKTVSAAKITKGGGVTVAVVDSGVDAGHPDLAGSILPGADFTEDGPGDGQKDSDGHGTAMAGLIAAHGRVRGVAPEAKILPVRTVTRSIGTGALARGIQWAVEQEADVISISQGSDYDDLAVREAVEAALAADIVVVAAAGNRTETKEVGYPASIAGVVAVSGVDRKGNHSSMSASGAAIDLAAPCDDVSSTYVGGTWTGLTGTSAATALVAGAAALARAHFPDMSAAEVVHRLTSTAVDRGVRGPDGEYGYGIVDASAVLGRSVPSLTPSADMSVPGTPQVDHPRDATPRRLEVGAVVAFGYLAGGLVLVLLGAWLVRSRHRNRAS
ncbi:S8 family serine peptidase [Catellatospora sichuanensis]|uniref:S8 family serine peptidase n=1 Tax=Catellatospora sichuanensis TaxID=1969805 RepID=UPI001183CEE4|nr:S8 family serine peptidase [Catellatospora sichuanensis]